MSAEAFGRFIGQMLAGLFLGKKAKKSRSPTLKAILAPAPAKPVSESPGRVIPPVGTHEPVKSDWGHPPIPKGFQIFYRGAVAGLHYRREDALSFIRSGEKHHLEVEPEPTNPHDKDAIKIIGVTAGRRHHLGYVPADVVQLLATLKMTDMVQIRLSDAYAGSNDYVEISFQFVGPKAHRNTFRDALKVIQEERYEQDQRREQERDE